MCRILGPVRRECLVHACTVGPGGAMLGGGYAGGFSPGQRRGMPRREALAHADLDTTTSAAEQITGNSTDHDLADHGETAAPDTVASV
jgi:hypothetical protein